MKKFLFGVILVASIFCSGFTYLMQTENDCGIAALSAVTGIAYEVVKKEIGHNSKIKVANDFLDNPAAHFSFLKKFNIPYANRSIGDVTSGRCKNEKTIILVHGQGKLGSWLAQHWCVLANRDDSFVYVYWGDNTMKRFTIPAFVDAVRRGGPTNTIYEIGIGSSKPKPWMEMASSFLKKIFGKW